MGLRVLDKGVGDPADVHQTVLMDADVHECSEGRDVGDDARQNLADPEIGELVNVRIEGECLEGGPRIAPGLRRWLE